MYNLIINVMKKLDYYFHYKFVLRFLLIEKLNYTYINSYIIPDLKKIKIYFSIKNLIDFNDLRSSNFHFLFRFFFGKKAIFVRYSTIFSLNVLYYNFIIQSIFLKKDMFFPIYFFFNDIIPYCNNRYFLLKRDNLVMYTIFDMNIFLEKKTNLWFFNLKNDLNIQFLSSGVDIEKDYLFLLFKFVNI
jgi:hypothetical protein